MIQLFHNLHVLTLKQTYMNLNKLLSFQLLMIKSRNLIPSHPPAKQLWKKQEIEPEIQVNFETLSIKVGTQLIDYGTSIITKQGIIPHLHKKALPIPPDTLLKFHNKKVIQQYCFQIAKSISRMTHSIYLKQRKLKSQEQTLKDSFSIHLSHCVPLISRIPPKIKCLIEVLKNISIGKIKILLETNETFVEILQLFNQATKLKQEQNEPLYRSAIDEVNQAMKQFKKLEINPQILELNETSYERISYMMQIFPQSPILINFLSDLNVCLVSKEISLWVTKLLADSSDDKKNRRTSLVGKQLIEKLESFIVIFKSTFALIGYHKKAAAVLKQIVMIDQIHHWLASEVEAISKNNKAKKQFVQLLGLFSIVDRNFVAKIYEQHHKNINHILTSELSLYYQQKISLKPTEYTLRSFLEIIEDQVPPKSAQNKNICLIIVANFIQYFQWIGNQELQAIYTLIKNNCEVMQKFYKPLITQITKKITKISQMTKIQRRKHKTLLILLTKILQSLKNNSIQLTETLISKLQSLKNDNQMLKNICNSITNPKQAKIPEINSLSSQILID